MNATPKMMDQAQAAEYEVQIIINGEYYTRNTETKEKQKVSLDTLATIETYQ